MHRFSCRADKLFTYLLSASATARRPEVLVRRRRCVRSLRAWVTDDVDAICCYKCHRPSGAGARPGSFEYTLKSTTFDTLASRYIASEAGGE